MNTTALQPAFVLHQRPYRETSALVDLFSADSGLLRVVVRGVKGGGKATSMRRSIVQAFNEVAVSWGGKGTLKTAHNIELIKSHQLVSRQQLYAGLYINELMLRLASHNEACSSLYPVYRNSVLTLEAVDIKKNNSAELIEVALRRFEMYLLETLGFEIDFLHCANNGAQIEPDYNYCYEVDHGFIACKKIERQNKNLPTINLKNIPGKIILALSKNNFEQIATRRYAKLIMRSALAQQLGDKPLKSRALYR